MLIYVSSISINSDVDFLSSLFFIILLAVSGVVGKLKTPKSKAAIIFIEALDPLTNKVMHVFTSARKAGEGLGIRDKKTVQKRMLAGKLVGGFLLRRQAA
jgi:hypothetical protein